MAKVMTLSMSIICGLCDRHIATATLNYPDRTKLAVCEACGERAIKTMPVNIKNVEGFLELFNLPVTDKQATEARPKVTVTGEEIVNAMGLGHLTAENVAIHLANQAGYLFSYSTGEWEYYKFSY